MFSAAPSHPSAYSLATNSFTPIALVTSLTCDPLFLTSPDLLVSEYFSTTNFFPIFQSSNCQIQVTPPALSTPIDTPPLCPRIQLTRPSDYASRDLLYRRSPLPQDLFSSRDGDLERAQHESRRAYDLEQRQRQRQDKADLELALAISRSDM